MCVTSPPKLLGSKQLCKPQNMTPQNQRIHQLEHPKILKVAVNYNHLWISC